MAETGALIFHYHNCLLCLQIRMSFFYQNWIKHITILNYFLASVIITTVNYIWSILLSCPQLFYIKSLTGVLCHNLTFFFLFWSKNEARVRIKLPTPTNPLRRLYIPIHKSHFCYHQLRRSENTYSSKIFEFWAS